MYMFERLERKKSLLYQIGLLSLVICIFIRNTTITFLPFWLSNIVPFSIFYAAFAIKILFLDHHSRKEWCVLIILLIYTVINYIECEFYVEPLVVFLLVFGSKNIDINDNLVKYFFCVCAIFLITIVLCLLGVIQDYIVGGRNDVARHSLGIIYPTDFAAHVFYLILLYSYLFEKKYSIVYVLCIFIIDFIVYRITYARLDFVLILVTPVVFWLFNKIQFLQKSKAIHVLLFSSIIIFCVIAFLPAVLYDPDNQFFAWLNDLLSTRLDHESKAFNEVGINIWGRNFISHNPDTYFFVDSGFLYILFLFGSVAFILFMYCLLRVGFLGVIKSDYKLLLVLSLISLSSVIEHHIVDISYNPFIIFFGWIVSDNKTEGA